jgi:hypothetical protein
MGVTGREQPMSRASTNVNRTGHALAPRCCIQSRYSRDVARNRKRRSSKGPATARPAQPTNKRSAPGARVARVAVDDETWEAFRELCGPTPASVRLGQLVEADVRRAAAGSPGSNASAALASMRQHLEALEAIVAVAGSESPAGAARS